MKSRFVFSIITLLVILSSSAQEKSNDIFEVRIIKVDKYNRSGVKIDSLGNIFKSGKSTNDKVNIETFNESIGKFLNSEKNIRKIPSNDVSWSINISSEKGEHIFKIRTTLLKDYYLEKDKKLVTNYYWVSVSGRDEKGLFFKYLTAEDKVILEKYL